MDKKFEKTFLQKDIQMANRFVKQIFKNVPNHYSSVQFSSVTQSCPNLCTPRTATRQASLSITNSQSSLRLMSVEWEIPTHHLIPFSSHLQSFPASGSFPMSQFRRAKYWSFNFSISPSSEYSGLISFRMDWLYLFTVQGTLRSYLQHHSSKASILRHSALFICMP